MNNLSCDIKKLLKKLEVLDDYDVERLIIEHLQRNLNTLDELQQSYQRHYLNIIRTLLQQLSLLPTLQQGTVQKRLAFLNKLLTQSPSLSDLETLHRGLEELQALLGPLPALTPCGQIIGDLPVGAHLPPAAKATENPHTHMADRIQSIQRNNDHFAQAVEKILQMIEKLSRGAHQDTTVQHDLIKQAQHLIQGQRQLALQLEQIQQQLTRAQLKNEQLQQELQRARALSMTDELTGLSNRRAFLQRLEEEIARVQRHPTPLTLAVIDIDHFKQVNDRHGHATGDEVLRTYAHHMLSVFRRQDHVARFGGEEFIILLPDTDEAGAVKALTKIRSQMADQRIQSKSGPIPMPTFSAGVASYQPKESSADFIERADQALYRAKQRGRNRIETSD